MCKAPTRTIHIHNSNWERCALNLALNLNWNLAYAVKLHLFWMQSQAEEKPGKITGPPFGPWHVRVLGKENVSNGGGNGAVPELLLSSILIAASLKGRRVALTVQILISVIAFQSGRSAGGAGNSTAPAPRQRTCSDGGSGVLGPLVQLPRETLVQHCQLWHTFRLQMSLKGATGCFRPTGHCKFTEMSHRSSYDFCGTGQFKPRVLWQCFITTACKGRAH